MQSWTRAPRVRSDPARRWRFHTREVAREGQRQRITVTEREDRGALLRRSILLGVFVGRDDQDKPLDVGAAADQRTGRRNPSTMGMPASLWAPPS